MSFYPFHTRATAADEQSSASPTAVPGRMWSLLHLCKISAALQLLLSAALETVDTGEKSDWRKGDTSEGRWCKNRPGTDCGASRVLQPSTGGSVVVSPRPSITASCLESSGWRADGSKHAALSMETAKPHVQKPEKASVF